MKTSKVFAAVLVAGTLFTGLADATSIGRSGGGGSHSSPSVSRSSGSTSHSYSAPSRPAPTAAPAPSHTGGIGGTTSSVGVRKSEVTNGVRSDIAATKPAPAAGSGSSYTPHYTPSPSYSYPSTPQPQVSGSSVFWNSLGGSFAGNLVGNALFNNHSTGGGTTVINNGTPGAGAVSSGPGVVSGNDAQFNPGGVSGQPKKEYGVWSFIADIIGFVFVIAILGLIAFAGYLIFKKVRAYINKERGVSNIPFNPTQRFWEIQKAFASADVALLNTLLGPDVVDELTNGLQPSTLTLHNVSHEVRLANNTEFSIWYKFEDDGAEVNQVWHYEKFGQDWKLNGIENV